MNYLNINMEHEFSSVICGKFESEDFVHIQRCLSSNVMIIVEYGIFNIEIGGRRYKVKPGELILLPSGVIHRGFRDPDTCGKVKYFWAHFFPNAEYAYADTRKGNFSLPVYFKLSDYGRARILYNQLLDVHRLTNVRQKYCDFLFTTLCCEIVTQFENANISGCGIVNKAVSWIELNINNPISLEDVSASLGYNKRYLSRIFKENIGSTINEFILQKKLTVAKQLLTGSDESIASISELVGFNDTRYFMRVFKKHEGLTCMQYRNSYSRMYLNNR